MYTSPTLYYKDKSGRIRIWRVWTEHDTILVEHGRHVGKKLLSKKTVKGKNIGRADETTPQIQAVRQAKSMFKHHVDKGYFHSIEQAQTTEVFLPMLASKFDEKKHRLLYPCISQPKMDGVRCLAYWKDDKVHLMSRGGKPYDVQHIVEECEKFLPKDQVFDGELYIHGVALQDINSLVKKPQEGSVELEYWIYDSIFLKERTLSCKDRLERLKPIYKMFVDADSVLKPVPWSRVSEERHVRPVETYWVERGFEGAIIRDCRGAYELGARSIYLQKVKSFMDEEFEIVGYKEGVGKFEGACIWECITDEGKSFSVAPKGTMEQRRKWFQTGDQYIGKMLTVQFFAWTNDNLPQFPVGLAVRLEEDI